MITNISSCAFTGHRPKSFSFGYNENTQEFLDLKERMKNSIIQACNAGCRTFYCGMAEGVDLWCAEIVLEIRERYTPALRLIPVVPFLKQPCGMSEMNKRRYHRIMESAEERFLVAREYRKDCYLKRNRFLVESADALIAVFDPKLPRSGTAQTIRLANAKKKSVFLIHI